MQLVALPFQELLSTGVVPLDVSIGSIHPSISSPLDAFNTHVLGIVALAVVSCLSLARHVARFGNALSEEQSLRWALTTTAVQSKIGDLGVGMLINIMDYHVVGFYSLAHDEVRGR